jgi:hypothetical protein
MNSLYVIGNGFDLYHNIDTYYSSFGLFLQKQHPEYYAKLTRYLFLPELDENDKKTLRNQLWSNFENSLTRLDLEELLDEYSDYTASPSDKSFSDGDWGAYAIEIEREVTDLTQGLINRFKEFIANVKFPESTSINHLKLNHEAFFLSFNYTDTLERYYNISLDKIIYIHGKVGRNNQNIVLGHGVTPESLIVKKYDPPKHLKPKELEIWKMKNLEDYDHSFMLGVNEVNQYVFKSFKQSADIIEKNELFFNSLNGVISVIILGHSLADVDMVYFKKIAEYVDVVNTKWTISWHNEGDDVLFQNKLLDLGIPIANIKLIKIEELRMINQLALF